MFKATKWILECEDTSDVVKNHIEDLVLNDFSDETIKKVISYAISVYGTKEKLVLSEKAADIVSQMLTEYGFITATTRLAWVDYTIAAVYIHNLFTEDNDWTSVFDARKNLTCTFYSEEVPEQVCTQIFKLVEAQYGEKMPVEMCRPIKNSPAELFFWAIWIAKNLLDISEEPIEKYSSDEPQRTSVELK